MIGLIALSLAAFANAQSADPLKPYLDGKPPQILREIPSPAAAPAGVTVRRVVFRSRDDSEIFAVIARPSTAGKYPGMLVLHGGGGSAEIDKAISWAARGYVAVAPDLPGIAEPKKLTETKGKWSALKYGEGRWQATPDGSASIIFDAILSAMNALYLLRAQPDVDTARIGVVGISWGGYMTTMVAGLAGDQLRAAFAVYGCGFYELTSQQTSTMSKMSAEERERWLHDLDAGRRAPGIGAVLLRHVDARRPHRVRRQHWHRLERRVHRRRAGVEVAHRRQTENQLDRAQHARRVVERRVHRAALHEGARDQRDRTVVVHVVRPVLRVVFEREDQGLGGVGAGGQFLREEAERVIVVRGLGVGRWRRERGLGWCDVRLWVKRGARRLDASQLRCSRASRCCVAPGAPRCSALTARPSRPLSPPACWCHCCPPPTSPSPTPGPHRLWQDAAGQERGAHGGRAVCDGGRDDADAGGLCGR